MSAITWINTDPTDASGASRLDDALRDFAVQTATGLGSTLSWPGSGGGATALVGPKLGTLRFAQSSSNRTGGYPDGFLSIDPKAGGLRHIGSAWTGYVSGANLLEHATPTGGAVWQTQSGTVPLSGPGNAGAVTFAVPYAAAPLVFVTASSQTYAVAVSSVATSGFTSMTSRLAGAGSGTLYWRSYGTVTL